MKGHEYIVHEYEDVFAKDAFVLGTCRRFNWDAELATSESEKLKGLPQTGIGKEGLFCKYSRQQSQ